MHIPFQMQNFAFVFTELQQVLRPAVQNSSKRQHYPPAHQPFAQFGITHKFAEGTFFPICPMCLAVAGPILISKNISCNQLPVRLESLNSIQAQQSNKLFSYFSVHITPIWQWYCRVLGQKPCKSLSKQYLPPHLQSQLFHHRGWWGIIYFTY